MGHSRKQGGEKRVHSLHEGYEYSTEFSFSLSKHIGRFWTGLRTEAWAKSLLACDGLERTRGPQMVPDGAKLVLVGKRGQSESVYDNEAGNGAGSSAQLLLLEFLKFFTIEAW